MTAAFPRSPAASIGTHGSASGKVGPNAILQLGHALREHQGERIARDVYTAAGLPDLLEAPPSEMVDERLVSALFRALDERLPRKEARAVAARAGARTAAYLLANRIPAPARAALAILPGPVSARLLLRAMARNAWTFAGSGEFRWRAGSPHVIEISRNPLAAPGCAWHVAVFEGLFRALVAPEARVRHTACCLDGDDACRFSIFRRHSESAAGAS